MLVDTHCHIQDSDYPLDINETIKKSKTEGVGTIVLASSNVETSRLAVRIAEKYSNITYDKAQVYALIGVHPAQVHKGYKEIERIYNSPSASRIIGVGEIGLDYHYGDKNKTEQIEALEWQIDFALKNNLAIEFHVRDAFDDFWTVIDNFKIKKADLHSFTDSIENVEKALKRDFFIGLNGISTFTKLKWQKDLYETLPLESILFETDAPYLTPIPYRGKVNEPARIKQIAEFHAKVRGLSLKDVTEVTTNNFKDLFSL